mmetsp:Transcript_56319/g.96956  ORF Transcript_56319/g.96956 Transcript_56319/m.96956 type:complete len:155 (-) Transcript_56319:271-735(-)
MDSINNHWNSIKSSVSTFFASASDEALKNAKAAVMQVEPPEAMVVAVESASASIRETVVVAESKVKEIETEVEAAKGVFNKEISTPISKAVCEFTTFRRKYPDAIIMMGGVSTGFYPLVWSTFSCFFFSQVCDLFLLIFYFICSIHSAHRQHWS